MLVNTIAVAIAIGFDSNILVDSKILVAASDREGIREGSVEGSRSIADYVGEGGASVKEGVCAKPEKVTCYSADLSDCRKEVKKRRIGLEGSDRCIVLKMLNLGGFLSSPASQDHRLLIDSSYGNKRIADLNDQALKGDEGNKGDEGTIKLSLAM